MLGALDGQPVDGVVVDHVGDAGEGPAAGGETHPSKQKNFLKGKVVYDFQPVDSFESNLFLGS